MPHSPVTVARLILLASGMRSLGSLRDEETVSLGEKSQKGSISMRKMGN